MKILTNICPDTTREPQVGDLYRNTRTPKLHLRASYDSWITFDPRDGRIWSTKSIPRDQLGERVPCGEITIRTNS